MRPSAPTRTGVRPVPGRLARLHTVAVPEGVRVREPVALHVARVPKVSVGRGRAADIPGPLADPPVPLKKANQGSIETREPLSREVLVSKRPSVVSARERPVEGPSGRPPARPQVIAKVVEGRTVAPE